MPNTGSWSAHTRRRFGEDVPKIALPEDHAALLSDAMTAMLGVPIGHYWCPTCDSWHVGRWPTTDKPKVRPFLPQSEMVLIELGERVLAALPAENSRKLGERKRLKAIRNRAHQAGWMAARRDLSPAEFAAYMQAQQSPNKTPKKGRARRRAVERLTSAQ